KALAQGRPDRAIPLIEYAVSQRAQPGRNVVTYSTNVIAQYYPYLRLADAYLQQRDLAGARSALKRSETWAREPEEERRRLAARAPPPPRAARRGGRRPPRQAAHPRAGADDRGMGDRGRRARHAPEHTRPATRRAHAAGHRDTGPRPPRGDRDARRRGGHAGG